MERFVALFLFLITSPIYPVLFVLIKFSSPGSFLFKQERTGLNKKPFFMYKFRTMRKVDNIEAFKKKYAQYNYLSWPLFKMKNDPRHTWIGKILIRTSIDELPQLINIIKGEMAFVGPRPFPVDEAKNITHKYDPRYSVLPGVTGLWAIMGFHNLSLDQWMEFDIEYVKKKNIWYDIKIILKTIKLLLKF